MITWVTPAILHPGKAFLQTNGIRGGNGVVRNPAGIADVDRADDAAGKTAGFEYTFQDPGDGGFAVGSRNAHHDHVPGGMAIEVGRCKGGDLPGVRRQEDPGVISGSQTFRHILGHRGRSPFFKGLADIIMTVCGMSLNGNEQAARFCLP